MKNKDTKKEIVPLDPDLLDKVTGGSNNQYGYNFCPYCGYDLRQFDIDKGYDENMAEFHLAFCKMLQEHAQKEAGNDQ